MKPLVFLAEDDEDDAFFLARGMSAAGLDVRLLEARDGAKALELLRAGGELPSLLVLDLKMPRVGGLEVLRAVRSDPRLRKIPAVILTSSFEGRDRRDAEDLGVDLFLRKPADSTLYRNVALRIRNILEVTGALR